MILQAGKVEVLLTLLLTLIEIHLVVISFLHRPNQFIFYLYFYKVSLWCNAVGKSWVPILFFQNLFFSNHLIRRNVFEK